MSPTVVLLMIIVPLMLVAAGFEWSSRMRDARVALRQRTPLRTLSADEHAALGPVRATTGQMHDNQVRHLSGPVDSDRYAWGDRVTNHARIAGVQVLLPFDAWRHLAKDNDAEVVLIGDMAVAVRLNRFHIVGAQRRAQRNAALDDADFDPPGLQPRTLRVVACAPSQWVGERLESPEEIALRRPAGSRAGGWGVASLAVWAAPFAVGDASHWAHWLFAAPTLAIAGLAIWLAVRGRRGQVTAARVLRVSGRLCIVGMYPVQAYARLIGNDRRIELPLEWLGTPHFQAGRHVLLDIRESDGQVLGAGPGWSLVDDRRGFPPHGAWWHLAWLGMLALVLVFAGLPALSEESPTWVLWWPSAAFFALWQAGQLLRKAWQWHRCSSRLQAELSARPAPTR